MFRHKECTCQKRLEGAVDVAQWQNPYLAFAGLWLDPQHYKSRVGAGGQTHDGEIQVQPALVLTKQGFEFQPINIFHIYFITFSDSGNI